MVLRWAWSWPEPFFHMDDGAAGVAIHGLAIARYASGAVYRFSCDASWECANDTDFDTIEAAMTAPSAQYDIRAVARRPVA